MSSPQPTPPPKTAIITCGVLEEEIAHFSKDMPHIVRTLVLPQGLHNEPDKLRRELQSAIDQTEAETDAGAIVLGYGLCSRGSEGVIAHRCRLVIARAHDCITHLLGGKERYAEYVKQHPGTYWYSPGWNKHHTPPGKERYDSLLREYTGKYGEDNAAYLMEAEQGWFRAYDRAAWVDLGVGQTEEGYCYTGKCAQWLGWNCDRQQGDPKLLIDLLAGHWDDDRFLVLEPGETFRFSGDERVIEKGPGHV